MRAAIGESAALIQEAVHDSAGALTHHVEFARRRAGTAVSALTLSTLGLSDDGDAGELPQIRSAISVRKDATGENRHNRQRTSYASLACEGTVLSAFEEELVGVWVHEDSWFRISKDDDGLCYREVREFIQEDDLQGFLSEPDSEGWLHTELKLKGGRGDVFGTVRLRRTDAGVLSEITSASSGLRRLREAKEGAFHPLLGDQPLVLDGQDTAVIIVFPKPARYHHTVMLNPLEECMKIFNRGDGTHNPVRGDILDPFRSGILDGTDGVFDPLRRPKMSGSAYQRAVRQLVVSKLERIGFQATTFESIDHDEVFVQVSLDRNGDVLKELAFRYEYAKPIRRTAYEQAALTPPTNNYGIFGPEHAVHAYVPFHSTIAELLEPLNQVDEILCINMYLREIFNFEELKRQGVVDKYFPASSFSSVAKLNEGWIGITPCNERSRFQKCSALRFLDAGWRCNRNCFFFRRRWLQFPFADINLVRAYFGEEVAFFFLWLGWFIASLGTFGLFGAFVGFGWIRAVAIFFGYQCEDRHVKYIFAIGTVIWASVLIKRFRRCASRFSQEWGVHQHTEHTFAMWQLLSTYRPELERTWNLSFRYAILKISGVSYIMAWVFVYFLIRISRHQISNYIALISSIWIFMGGNLWSRIVPHLINLQNHKIQARWDAAIAHSLCFVKLFLSLFPPLYIAFIKKHVEIQCADSFVEAVNTIYYQHGSSSWGGPMMINKTDPVELDFVLERLPFPASWRTPESPIEWKETLALLEDSPYYFQRTGAHHTNTLVHFFQEYLARFAAGNESSSTSHRHHQRSSGTEHCIYGCYPMHCYLDSNKHYVCMTNCEELVWWQLCTCFFLHMVITVVLYDIIPSFLAWVTAKKELLEANGVIPSSCAAMAESAPTCGGCTECSGTSSDDEETRSTTPRTRGRKAIRYTWMQLQAKCFEIAEYKYWSWGGSLVEDFMELMVGFALLMCFSNLFPLMPGAAFLCYLVEYRLLAFRMVNVTCRPWPYSALGIGPWANIALLISVIGIFSIVWSAALKDETVHVMTYVQENLISFHENDRTLKTFNFAIMQGIMLTLFGVLQIIVPDVPDDVLKAEDAHKKQRYEILHALSKSTPQTPSRYCADLSNVLTEVQKEFESSSASSDSESSPRSVRTPRREPRELQVQFIEEEHTNGNGDGEGGIQMFNLEPARRDGEQLGEGGEGIPLLHPRDGAARES